MALKRVEILEVENGGYVIVTGLKCITVAELDKNALSKIRAGFGQQELGEKVPQDPIPCPYCNSNETIGHGTKETAHEVLIRRFCKHCKKTFVLNRENKEVLSTKDQVAFLKTLGYDEKDIVTFVGRSKSTVRAHLENLDIEKYRAQKELTEQEEQTTIPAKEEHPVQRKSAGADNQTIDREASYEAPQAAEGEKPHCEHEPEEDPIPAHTVLAPEFDRMQAHKEHIGNCTIWVYNGRTAASAKGQNEVVFLKNTDILHMITLRKNEGRQKLEEYISGLQTEQRNVVSEFIETKVDESLGMLPMVKMSTRAEEAEINADNFEKGAYGETAESESGE